jgi:hypothetical protein
LPKIFVGVYTIVSLVAYIAVFNAPPDGLANLPLVLAHLPSIVLERLATKAIYGSMDGYLWEPLVKSLGLPGGYILTHAYWFLPLTILQAYFIFSLEKRFSRNQCTNLE